MEQPVTVMTATVAASLPGIVRGRSGSVGWIPAGGGPVTIGLGRGTLPGPTAPGAGVRGADDSFTACLLVRGSVRDRFSPAHTGIKSRLQRRPFPHRMSASQVSV
jgi:hypothetical protein